MATDYDKGKVTDREKLAAKRQKALAKSNADALKDQLDQQIYTYDLADKQNKALRDLQLKQNARKSETDRFEAQRNLQNAALGLFGSMNQAMNGSTVGNAMRMLEDRNDAENDIYWQQLQDNQNSVNNAYNESYAQNQIARRDAAVNATKAIRDIQGDLAANLSNINPNLYQAPNKNSDLNKVLKGVDKTRKAYSKANAYQPSLSGYIMPPNAEQAVRGQRNRLLGNDYYDRLINGFNGR